MAPQSERFGIGGVGAIRADVSPWDFLGFQVGASYGYFPVEESYDFEGEGLVAPERGTAVTLSGGFRFRILNDQRGYALAWRRGPQYRHSGNLAGNLWVDVNLGWTRTGALDRLSLDAGLGYEMSVVDGLQVGVLFRYLHVFQPDDQLDGADAKTVILGASFSVAIPTRARFEVLEDPDGDEIYGDADGCPESPEDRDGIEDDDGCPEDNDGDGVLDIDDRCPDSPEDADGFEDDDGCPDDDNDQDGHPDVNDACPSDPEDVDEFEDDDGCPERDNDADGLFDEDDQCPVEPEVVNGVDDDDGCPDEADIEVVDDDILLRDRVYFDFAMARVRGRSWPLLHQIARLLEAHPEYVEVSIEGHCDHVGPDSVNQRLSERRASRVRDHLIEREGVAPERLSTVGYGRTRLLIRSTSERARQLNRRVEFRIVLIDRSAQQGRALPRRGRHVAPHLGPGGAIMTPEEAAELEREREP